MFDASACVKTAADCAFAAADLLSTRMQLRKERGLPRITEMIVKARRRRESIAAMMRRPRLA